MPTFRYKAVTEPGDVIEGELEAASQAAVIDHLRGRGFLPIRAEPLGERSLSAWLDRELGRRHRVSRQDVTTLIRELATLLKAGLALDQALTTLITFAEKEPLRELVKRILERVRGGASLTDAMAAEGRTFSRFSLGMVRAGETGGALDAVLAKTAEFMEKSHQSVQNLKSALLYPIILLVSAALSVGIIVTVVIPSFKEIFEDAGIALPLPTRIVMGVGTLAETAWWVPLVIALIGVLVVLRKRRDPEARQAFDRRLLGLPVIGSLFGKIEAMRMSYTLGMLLSNGVPLVSALSVVRTTLGNAAMAAAFAGIEAQVKEGKTFAGPLEETELFPKLATHLIRIGEESGQLETMLFRVADAYERDIQHSVQRLMTLLVPLLTFAIALLIAGIIVSILIPMLSINELAF